jgi:hypothetical protein
LLRSAFAVRRLAPDSGVSIRSTKKFEALRGVDDTDAAHGLLGMVTQVARDEDRARGGRDLEKRQVISGEGDVAAFVTLL